MSCTQNCNQGRNCTCRQACELPDIERPAPWPLRFRDLLIVICGAALLCWLLGVFGPSLDEHDSASTTDAQAQARAELHRDLAAARICREDHGDASFTWTVDGELVCIPRHRNGQLASNP